ncbi:MAG: bifunctional riboflavin kinase/FAD synthetase [Dehalococcoidaceae bacterium]|nr:bifunctional riboflavin kinase/FAD synthetase [Dehalococcoidaceae bacterium]
MSLEEEFQRFTPDGDTLFTIGVFDGVHVGHQKLLAELTAQAENRGLSSGVITFNNHPLSQLNQNPPPLLASVEEKNRLLKQTGVDLIANLDFSPQLASTGARQFCQMLINHLKMKGLVLGFDFAMGRNREGSLEMMQLIAAEMGFTLSVVAPVKIEGEIVSSTAVRRMLLAGEVERTTRFLGRNYGLEGKVVAGKGLGKQLDFPTANIEIDSRFVVPPDGIYATLCFLNGQRYFSATNIGTGPTFGGSDRRIEVHLLDFDGELYGKNLKIELVSRIRDELKFETREALIEQINRDILQARQILERMASL